MLRTGERGYESNGKKRTKTEESVDNERKSFAHLLKPTIGKHITPLSPLLLSPPSLYLAPYLILSLCLFTFLSLIHRFFFKYSIRYSVRPFFRPPLCRPC